MNPLKVKPSKADGKGSIKPKPMVGIEPEKVPDNEDLVSRIAVSAYYKADARGYEPGHEIQDWLEAEAEMQQ
ncbi:MAG: DUF2934 domain-containing protein [Methylotenera sp.]